MSRLLHVGDDVIGTSRSWPTPRVGGPELRASDPARACTIRWVNPCPRLLRAGAPRAWPGPIIHRGRRRNRAEGRGDEPPGPRILWFGGLRPRGGGFPERRRALRRE